MNNSQQHPYLQSKNKHILNVFQIIDDFEVASGIPSYLEEVCVSEAQYNATLTNEDLILNNGTEGTILPKDVQDLLNQVCPNQCSGHGNCSDGICICDTGRFHCLQLEFLYQ